MIKRGILLDTETGDLAIKVTRDAQGLITGGLVVGDIQKQNQAIIINMQPGEIKGAPQMGVGIDDMLLSSEALLYKHRIREQLEDDGYEIEHLEIEITPDDKVDIQLNAKYI
ncbi:hypothetical protein LJB95_03380 [Paludibacteraceae bacterium OttesenSCG-928-F17]|nr:hypothetical protein [Paludibacteraceae bacterium OttesenSCG-928-F17]